MAVMGMSKRTKSISAAERKRRELRGYLDQLRQVKNPTKQDLDLMIELRQALSQTHRR
jgi:hypothetical protein